MSPEFKFVSMILTMIAPQEHNNVVNSEILESSHKNEFFDH